MKYICSAALISVECCCAEVVINTEEGFQHFAYEMSWRAKASIEVNNPAKDEWFTHEKYKESIFKVIAKAIADCAHKKEEFKDYNGLTKIVEFAGTDPKDYTPENLNAVVLWNFLAYVMDKRYAAEKVTIDNDGVDEVGRRIYQYYRKHYGIVKDIAGAVSDIQAYATDLDLYGYIKSLKKDRDEYKILKKFNNETKNGEFRVVGTIKYEDKVITGNIFVSVRNGKVDEITTESAKYPRFGNIDEEFNVRNLKEVEQKVPLNLDAELLDADKIHELKNYLCIQDKIIGQKCFLVATVTALYNSPRFRQEIDRLAENQETERYGVEKWRVSHAIKRLFAIIRRDESKDNTDEAAENLLTSMERVDVIEGVEEDNDEMTPIEIKYNEAKERMNHLTPTIYRLCDFRQASDFMLKLLVGVYNESECIDGKAKANELPYIRRDCIVEEIGGKHYYTGYNITYPSQMLKTQKHAIEINNVQKQKTTTANGEGYTQVDRFPEVLIVNAPNITGQQLEATFPEEMELTDNEGQKKYKVVSTVETHQTGEHFIATMRTQQGWYAVDSLRSVTKIPHGYEEKLPSSHRNWYRHMVIYERVG